MLVFIGACFIYLICAISTFIGIYQVIIGLQRFSFLSLIWGCFILRMNYYMIGELAPVIVELHHKL